jgi:hypothetical protein
MKRYRHNIRDRILQRLKVTGGSLLVLQDESHDFGFAGLLNRKADAVRHFGDL